MTDEQTPDEQAEVDPHASTALGYPYPVASDPVAGGAAAIQALAQKLDTGPIDTATYLTAQKGTVRAVEIGNHPGNPLIYFGPQSDGCYLYASTPGGLNLLSSKALVSKGLWAHRHPYPGDRHIESGRLSIPGGNTQTSVVFTRPFSTLPVVSVDNEANAGAQCVIVALYVSSVLVQNFAGGALIIDWIAEGPD